jgi:hypothetical protein
MVYHKLQNIVTWVSRCNIEPASKKYSEMAYDLLDSAFIPQRYGGKHAQPITVLEEDGYFVEGNHRAAELMARAGDPNNKFIEYSNLY